MGRPWSPNFHEFPTFLTTASCPASRYSICFFWLKPRHSAGWNPILWMTWPAHNLAEPKVSNGYPRSSMYRIQQTDYPNVDIRHATPIQSLTYPDMAIFIHPYGRAAGNPLGGIHLNFSPARWLCWRFRCFFRAPKWLGENHNCKTYPKQGAIIDVLYLIEMESKENGSFWVPRIYKIMQCIEYNE